MVRLICIASSSSGNSFALDAGSEILLLEAGIRHSLVTKAIGFRDDKVVGCLISHRHIDHAKYAEEYVSRGVKVYCNQDVKDAKKFPFGTCEVMEIGKTISIGSFRVSALPLHHDVPTYSYLIQHPDMGVAFFALDTYKLDAIINGVDHFIIEANYDDRILKANVEDGKIDRAQANRLMLSHMSVKNTVHYLKECHAEKSRNIILCHLSERNSDPEMFRQTVAGAFGVPTYIAEKGTVVQLNKEVI